MTTTDISSAYLFLGLLYLVMPAITWVVLAGDRCRSVALWCVGSVLLGVSLLVFSFSHRLFHPLVIPSVRVLLFISIVMRVQAMRIELDVPWKTQNMAWVTLAYTVIYGMIMLWPAVRQPKCYLAWRFNWHSMASWSTWLGGFRVAITAEVPLGLPEPIRFR